MSELRLFLIKMLSFIEYHDNDSVLPKVGLPSNKQQKC